MFFRLGDNSEVRMVSPGLADTRVELLKGSAMLEVTELFKENDLAVTVYQGGAQVKVKKGHETLLAHGQALKSQKLNEEAVETDPIYRWSSLRSRYEAEANMDTPQTVVVNGGWYDPGWYWNPFWGFYSSCPVTESSTVRLAGNSTRPDSRGVFLTTIAIPWLGSADSEPRRL